MKYFEKWVCIIKNVNSYAKIDKFLQQAMQMLSLFV